MEVQFALVHHVQAMVKPERNRQIMCEGGLVSTLLAHCQSMLLAPNHPLHLPITRILEKLSSQAITLSDFRSDIFSLWGSDTFTSFVQCRWRKILICLHLKSFLSICANRMLYPICSLFFCRKFLCLGHPLMCLADKPATQSQPDPVSNGIYLFCDNDYLYIVSCMLFLNPLEV